MSKGRCLIKLMWKWAFKNGIIELENDSGIQLGRSGLHNTEPERL